MAKAGLQGPEAKVPKKNKAGEFCPPENDDLAVESHLKSLDKEEKSRNKRASMVCTLMTETQLYREAGICSLDAATRVRETMAKNRSLQNLVEVSSLEFLFWFPLTQALAETH